MLAYFVTQKIVPMKPYRAPIALLFCLTCAACKKEEAIEFSRIPTVKVIDVSPRTVQEFTDLVSIRLEYTDGDGNLGSPNPDQAVVLVTDSRLSTPDTYHLPPLAPPDANIPIKGVVDVVLKNSFVLGNAQQQTITYSVQLQDQSGNKSNVAQTPAITIVK